MLEKHKEHIIKNINDFGLSDRKKILAMIKSAGASNFVQESSNGSHIDLNKLSDELILQIYLYMNPDTEGFDISSDESEMSDNDLFDTTPTNIHPLEEDIEINLE